MELQINSAMGSMKEEIDINKEAQGYYDRF